MRAIGVGAIGLLRAQPKMSTALSKLLSSTGGAAHMEEDDGDSAN